MTATIAPDEGAPLLPSDEPRRAPRRRLGAWVLRDYAILGLAVLVVILPLLYLFVSSFKTPTDIGSTHLHVFPERWRWANYSEALHKVPLARMFLNSLLVTSVASALKVLLAILTAYGFVFCDFPGKKYLFWLVLATLMVPPQVSALPNFVLISSWHGTDTYWGIILPGLGTGFGTFLLRQAFLQLPVEIIEAAHMDGAGHWKRLWHCVVPMALPSIATVALVNIVYEWNDYLWPSIVIVNDTNKLTLPPGISLLGNADNPTLTYGVQLAGTVLVVLPVLIVFAVLQKHIVKGFTQGGVKG